MAGKENFQIQPEFILTLFLPPCSFFFVKKSSDAIKEWFKCKSEMWYDQS